MIRSSVDHDGEEDEQSVVGAVVKDKNGKGVERTSYQSYHQLSSRRSYIVQPDLAHLMTRTM